MDLELRSLIESLRGYTAAVDDALLQQAYDFAKQAHAGQTRLSSAPYFSHCVEVARILTQMELDCTTVAAGLLHDVVEDTDYSISDVAERFGEEIALLVGGVTNISALSFKSTEEHQAENLRKMLIAMAKDIRVILIKLADRAHNMRTLSALPPNKIRRISKDTLDIYAPLAHRLGIARIKWELEDAAFRYLEPEAYRDLAQRVASKREERERYVRDTAQFLQQNLEEAGVAAEVTGRPKHLYSVHKKMREQGREFEQVYDLLALRIITDTVADCYAALGVVHNLWTPVPGRFKDFIAVPKSNMYQSIHATVMREVGEPLEIQIRTREMHRTAEQGIAAHWKYKEGVRKTDERLDQQLAWFRQMIEWLQEPEDSRDFIEGVKGDLFSNEVYVFTPKGEVKVLPKGSTPIDFAYSVHTDIGDHCAGAKVNAKMVPLRYNLKHGDVVQIITSKAQSPHRDWLDAVKTSKAKSKIRRALKEVKTETAGKQPERSTTAPPRVVEPTARRSRAIRTDDAAREKLILIEGKGGIAVRFGKCCNPVPGEDVVGYVTVGRGLTVHRTGCASVHRGRHNPKRFVNASWVRDGKGTVIAGVRVMCIDRPNLLADILNSFSGHAVNLQHVRTYPVQDNKGMVDLVFELNDEKQLDKITSAVHQVSGITAVRSLKEVDRQLGSGREGATAS
jgi:guanosine-3',5'-bis(diphosphate) 3'-pyrophosphohydrolase